VPEFLSSAWLDELDGAARAAGPVPGIAPFVIEQVVTGVRGRGEVRYRLVFDDSGLRVDTDTARGDADVVFTTDHATAAGIARGDANAQQALADGAFRVGGALDTLVARSDALSALTDIFSTVRHTTTFDTVARDDAARPEQAHDVG
jgi:hypothetical protein